MIEHSNTKRVIEGFSEWQVANVALHDVYVFCIAGGGKS